VKKISVMHLLTSFQVAGAETVALQLGLMGAFEPNLDVLHSAQNTFEKDRFRHGCREETKCARC